MEFRSSASGPQFDLVESRSKWALRQLSDLRSELLDLVPGKAPLHIPTNWGANHTWSSDDIIRADEPAQDGQTGEISVTLQVWKTKATTFASGQPTERVLRGADQIIEAPPAGGWAVSRSLVTEGRLILPHPLLPESIAEFCSDGLATQSQVSSLRSLLNTSRLRFAYADYVMPRIEVASAARSKSVLELPRRIFGIESEMGVHVENPESRRSLITNALVRTGSADDEMSEDERVRRVREGTTTQAVIEICGIAEADGIDVGEYDERPRVFLPNGSLIYFDMGLEHASAETDDLLDLVRVDRAGEVIIAEAATELSQRYREIGTDDLEKPDPHVSVFENNTDLAGNSYGCHENFLVRRELDYRRLRWYLTPLLVSRPILVGSGGIVRNGDDASFELCVSQRSEHIFSSFGNSSTSHRPMILIRDEPHGDRSRWNRLQLLTADTNMNEHGTFLKTAMVHFALRLIEREDSQIDRQLERCILWRPSEALRLVGSDTTLDKPVMLADGKWARPREILGVYLELAEQMVVDEEMTSSEQQAVEVWRELADLADSCDPAMRRKVDWVMKNALLADYMDNVGCGLDDPRVRLRDFKYHDLNPQSAIYPRLRQRGLVHTLVSDDEARAWMTRAPRTRAYLRAKIIEAAREGVIDVDAMDWSTLLLIEHSQPREVQFSMIDPYADSDHRIEAFLADARWEGR